MTQLGNMDVNTLVYIYIYIFVCKILIKIFLNMYSILYNDYSKTMTQVILAIIFEHILWILFIAKSMIINCITYIIDVLENSYILTIVMNILIKSFSYCLYCFAH